MRFIYFAIKFLKCITTTVFVAYGLTIYNLPLVPVSGSAKLAESGCYYEGVWPVKVCVILTTRPLEKHVTLNFPRVIVPSYQLLNMQPSSGIPTIFRDPQVLIKLFMDSLC